MTKVLVVGDINVDIALRVSSLPSRGGDVEAGAVRWGSGGGGLNAAVALHELGAQPLLVGRVGSDEAAPLALGELSARGLEAEAVQVDEQLATGVCIVLISDDGERTFLSFRGANAATEMPSVAVSRAVELLHVSAYALLQAPQRTTATALIEQVAGAGGKVSLDLCGPRTREIRQCLSDLVPQLWTVAANDEELGAWFPEQAAAEAAELLVRRGVEHVARKRGHLGCTIVTPGASFSVAPPATAAAVDTTACGDVFAAAWAFGVRQGASLRDAARLAGALAAQVAATRGAARAVPSRADLTAIGAAEPDLLRVASAMQAGSNLRPAAAAGVKETKR